MKRNDINLTKTSQGGPGAPSVLHGTIVTRADQPRDYRRCQCDKCKKTDICTPRTDFVPGPGGKLICKGCAK